MSGPDTSSAPGSVVCIGVFDGVHRGHRALVSHARTRADALGLPLVIVTFDPHPLTVVVGPDAAPTSLASIGHRVELLLEAGADEVDVLEFDAGLAATEARDFVRLFLVDRLGVREVVVGEDFRFGHRALGTVETLRQEGARHGFAVDPMALVGSGTQRWSSTLTRGLLESGDVDGAAAVLGRWYRLDGRVVHGDHRGRELGYPTANLAWQGRPTVPGDGVYAGWLATAQHRYPAAVSVGTNPQFDGRERRVEAYVLDRDDLDLYDEPVGVEFVARIRGQRVFAGVPELVEQMASDVAQVRTLLNDRAASGPVG